MHKTISFIIILLFTGLLLPNHSAAQCGDTNFSFKPGEVVNYHAYYNWGFIWINAGEVQFSVESDHVLDRPAYRMKAYGSTYKTYDRFFKVRDTFEVKVDTIHLEPFEFKRITYEGSYRANYMYHFNRQDRSISALIQKEEEPQKQIQIPWQSCSFDILTMVYKARNIDFSSYQTDDKIPINMVVDGKIHNLFIRYLGKEIIKNRDGRQFKCLKFSPLLVEGTIFKSGEDMTVWVTDDQNRIPIIVEAKILIGSVKAVFVDAKGLRHPITAEIN